MKKKFFSKHIAGGLAVALVVAVSIPMTSVTFPQKSDISDFSSVTTLNAHAAEPLVINEVDDFDVQSNEVKGLSTTGMAKLNTPGYDSVILHFPASLPAIKIADDAFSGKFTD